MHITVFLTLICLSLAWLGFEIGRYSGRAACAAGKAAEEQSRVEYRFIPRTLDEELALPPEALAVLRSLI